MKNIKYMKINKNHQKKINNWNWMWSTDHITT